MRWILLLLYFGGVLCGMYGLVSLPWAIGLAWKRRFKRAAQVVATGVLGIGVSLLAVGLLHEPLGWAEATAENTVKAWELYLRREPLSRRAADARVHLSAAKMTRMQRAADVEKRVKPDSVLAALSQHFRTSPADAPWVARRLVRTGAYSSAESAITRALNEWALVLGFEWMTERASAGEAAGIPTLVFNVERHAGAKYRREGAIFDREAEAFWISIEFDFVPPGTTTPLARQVINVFPDGQMNIRSSVDTDDAIDASVRKNLQARLEKELLVTDLRQLRGR